MAGIGKRLRPFTLTTPKPLFKIAGKPIVQWLVEKISKLHGDKITDVGFIIGNFPDEVAEMLHNIAKSLGLNSHIYYQRQALGTAHAVSMASELMNGETVIAFADTLFDTDVDFSIDADAVIWTKKVDNPERYGVVLKHEDDVITGFKEKPETFVSDEAIIGIYYFKKGEILKQKIDYIIDNQMIKGGEYLLTDALQMMLDDGLLFKSYTVSEWLDCGNKDLVLQTMKYVVENFVEPKNFDFPTSKIIPPVYIGINVKINNSVIGPYAVVDNNTIVENSNVKNSIILENSQVANAVLDNSIIGNNSKVIFKPNEIALGDFNEI